MAVQQLVSILLILSFGSSVLAHDVMTTPTPLAAPESTTRHCGSGTNAALTAPVTSVQAGSAITVTWKGAHVRDQPNTVVNLHLIAAAAGSTANPTQQAVDAAVLASNLAYTTPSQAITIPASTAAGTYLLHWQWTSYHSCAFIRVTAAASSNSGGSGSGGNTGAPSNTVGPGSGRSVANGQVDPLTGEITCNSGYALSGEQCVLNGGAVFGIFLLVLVVVGVAGFVGVMAYFRSNRPELYHRIKGKMMFHKSSSSPPPAPASSSPAPAPVAAAATPSATPVSPSAAAAAAKGRALPPLPPGAPPVPAKRPVPPLPPRNPMYHANNV